MTTHTPGPETDGFTCADCSVNDECQVILCSFHAAAPELLEACVLAATDYALELPKDTDTDPRAVAIRAVRFALAKASGGA